MVAAIALGEIVTDCFKFRNKKSLKQQICCKDKQTLYLAAKDLNFILLPYWYS
jgi:hypothetical protein